MIHYTCTQSVHSEVLPGQVLIESRGEEHTCVLREQPSTGYYHPLTRTEEDEQQHTQRHLQHDCDTSSYLLSIPLSHGRNEGSIAMHKVVF